jgi:hypothetical protein|tara:strand:+ start:8023 stop:8409 length:387 start_codon:yes stop_codon:yes gene_type:complete
MAQTTTTVEVAGEAVTMRLPASYASTLDLIRVLNSNYHRGLGACVGACWPDAVKWPGQKQPSARLLAMDGLDYGGRVIDDLTSNGMPWSDLVDIGEKASDMVVRYQITEKEIARTADFSEAPEEGQTG